MAKLNSKLDSSSPLLTETPTKRQALAIQALNSGTATEEQQKFALSYIINVVCKTYDMAYRPGADGARETDLALGKQVVGQHLVKCTKLKVSLLK